MKITIDGVETEVLRVEDTHYGTEIQLESGEWVVVFSSAAEAGVQARQYWEDLAFDDPEEFVCIVGAKALVAWAVGNWARTVKSLEEWLDLHLDRPVECWNRVDSSTWLDICIKPNSMAADEIGFDGEAVGYPQ